VRCVSIIIHNVVFIAHIIIFSAAIYCIPHTPNHHHILRSSRRSGAGLFFRLLWCPAPLLRRLSSRTAPFLTYGVLLFYDSSLFCFEKMHDAMMVVWHAIWMCISERARIEVKEWEHEMCESGKLAVKGWRGLHWRGDPTVLSPMKYNSTHIIRCGGSSDFVRYTIGCI